MICDFEIEKKNAQKNMIYVPQIKGFSLNER